MSAVGGKLDVSSGDPKDHLHKGGKANEIKEIKNYKQLEKIDFDFDSPRFKKALYNLGVSKEECMKKYFTLGNHIFISFFRERSEFERKGVEEDIINLRYKHYQNRLIDTINRILEERRRISKHA